MAQYMVLWRKMPLWVLPNDFQPHTQVSVLIPARNEAEHIVACLDSILKNNYPAHLLEIIVLDDHSEDATADLVRRYPSDCVRVLSLADFPLPPNTQSFKKRAIELGIQHSRGELIVTTDADCLVGEAWLPLLVSRYESDKPVFIAAPVNFWQEKNVFERFQSLDYMGMMGVTAAGIATGLTNMCNGANMAYQREAFFVVDGFKGIDHLASGDDMLLMQKMARKYPHRIAFLKNCDARILTYPKATVQEFIQQRIRWASKSTSYKEWYTMFQLIGTFFFCCNMLLLLIVKPIFALAAYLLKLACDYLQLSMMARFFRRDGSLLRHFWLLELYYLAYIIGIGILANLIKKYEWKGRKVQ